jgi:hypothetical protein
MINNISKTNATNYKGLEQSINNADLSIKDYQLLKDKIIDHMKVNDHHAIMDVVAKTINYLSNDQLTNENVSALHTDLLKKGEQLTNDLINNPDVSQEILESNINSMRDESKSKICNYSGYDIISNEALYGLINLGIIFILISSISKNVQDVQKGFAITQNSVYDATNQLADLGGFLAELQNLKTITGLDINSIITENHKQPFAIIVLRLLGGDNAVKDSDKILNALSSDTKKKITDFLITHNIKFNDDVSYDIVMAPINKEINFCNSILSGIGSGVTLLDLFKQHLEHEAPDFDKVLADLKVKLQDISLKLKNIKFTPPLLNNPNPENNRNNFTSFLNAAFANGGNTDMQKFLQDSPVWGTFQDKLYDSLASFSRSNFWSHDDYELMQILVSKGIFNKTFDGNYYINDNISRQQFMTKLFDYFKTDSFFINADTKLENLIYKHATTASETDLFKSVQQVTDKYYVTTVDTNNLQQVANELVYYAYTGYNDGLRSNFERLFNLIKTADIDFYNKLLSGKVSTQDMMNFFNSVNSATTNEAEIVDKINDSKKSLSGVDKKINAYIDSLTQSLNLINGVFVNFSQFMNTLYR